MAGDQRTEYKVNLPLENPLARGTGPAVLRGARENNMCRCGSNNEFSESNRVTTAKKRQELAMQLAMNPPHTTTTHFSGRSMRILVTGSREWTDSRAIENVLLSQTSTAHKNRELITVIHGANTHGADQIAAGLARFHGWEAEPHPAAWELHGKAAGPLRNQEMVDTGADVCLAFPIGESRGTRDCIRRARKAGIPVVITHP